MVVGGFLVGIVNPAIGVESIVPYRSTVDRTERLRRVFAAGADGIYRYILVRVGGNRHVADDLLQQTCHEAARGRGLPEADADCEAWFRGIARNLIRRHWRQIGRQKGDVSLDSEHVARQLAADMESHPLPPEALARKETAEQLLAAVTALAADDQRLIFAFYFEGRSQADIAEQVGASTKSVETRLYRARQRLRAALHQPERI